MGVCMCVRVSVCPSVRVCVNSFFCEHNISKSYERVLILIFWRGGERGPGRNRLDFGGDPDSFADPASFSMILCH